MISAEQRSPCTVDYCRFERFLFHISRLVQVSLEIRDPEGQTLLSVPGKAHGIMCAKQDGYCEGLVNLCRRVERSERTIVQTCQYSADIIGIPLKHGRGLAAILLACSMTDRGIKTAEAEFLEEVAARISFEIHYQSEMDDFARELSDKYEQLSLIYDIGKKLGGMSAANESFRFIAEQSKDTLNADIAILTIPGKEIHEISCSSADPFTGDGADRSLIEKVSKAVMERFNTPDMHPASIVLNDVRGDVQFSHLSDTPMGIAAVPVNSRETLVGFLCVINRSPEKSIQTGDVKLLMSLTEQVSMALTNEALYLNLKDFLINVIKTLAYSIEAKDAYTKGHSERVNALSMMMGDSMNLSPIEKEALNWASILHDIGKIGVRGEILTKPGRLTEEEFLQIRKHPEQGYRILLPIEQLKESLKGIRHHHERFDGNGYPSGIKGRDIPLYARVIAVADTYDAMTTDRSYRSRMSHKDAIDEIKRVKGLQLDPEIVDIFMSLFKAGPPTYTCSIKEQGN